jgi:hypothetical protein
LALRLMTTNGKPQEATELEAELLRLNTLVRERRKQLVRLEKCPNKDCPCRVVWRNHVEKNLAGQVGKIRRKVSSKTAQPAKPKRQPKPSPATSQQRRGMPRRRSA